MRNVFGVTIDDYYIFTERKDVINQYESPASDIAVGLIAGSSCQTKNNELVYLAAVLFRQKFPMVSVIVVGLANLSCSCGPLRHKIVKQRTPPSVFVLEPRYQTQPVTGNI